MIKGGYKVIDFKGSPFTSGEEASVDGLHAAVSNPYGKATMVSGLVVGDVAYPDFFAPFTEGGGNYSTSVVIGGSTITIAVDSDDNVTVTVA